MTLRPFILKGWGISLPWLMIIKKNYFNCIFVNKFTLWFEKCSLWCSQNSHFDVNKSVKDYIRNLTYIRSNYRLQTARSVNCYNKFLLLDGAATLSNKIDIAIRNRWSAKKFSKDILNYSQTFGSLQLNITYPFSENNWLNFEHTWPLHDKIVPRDPTWI